MPPSSLLPLFFFLPSAFYTSQHRVATIPTFLSIKRFWRKKGGSPRSHARGLHRLCLPPARSSSLLPALWIKQDEENPKCDSLIKLWLSLPLFPRSSAIFKMFAPRQLRHICTSGFKQREDFGRSVAKQKTFLSRQEMQLQNVAAEFFFFFFGQCQALRNPSSICLYMPPPFTRCKGFAAACSPKMYLKLHEYLRSTGCSWPRWVRTSCSRIFKIFGKKRSEVEAERELAHSPTIIGRRMIVAISSLRLSCDNGDISQ